VARRQQRRPRFQPPRAARKQDDVAAQAALDASARRLLGSHDARSLQGLVNDLMQVCDEADRAAFESPSPQALYAFRRARHELAVAERALSLAEAHN
jgi:hypothetical protein